MKPVHKKGVIIVIIFGVISVLILILLEVEQVFPIIVLWMLVPVIIKKLSDRMKKVIDTDDETKNK
ncbi:MAG: hypothetical protein ACOC85_00250 [Thermoplasmatota archaeon]